MKRFPKLELYDKLPELKKRLLGGEAVTKIQKDLTREKFPVSVSYLNDYKKYLQAVEENRSDGILMELEQEGLIPYVSETSFLKAVIAHAFKDVKEATLKEGLEAAKLLIDRELKLPKNQSQKLKETLSRYFDSDGNPTKAVQERSITTSNSGGDDE